MDIDDEILALAGDSPVKSRTRSRRERYSFTSFYHFKINYTFQRKKKKNL